MQESIWNKLKKKENNPFTGKIFRGGYSTMSKTNEMRKRIYFTIIMIMILVTTMVGIIAYMYQHSEKIAYEQLRLETEQFKNNIYIQVNSDFETLRSMASLVSERYSDEESYIHVCRNFEAFGFCENIGILLPDNRLVTKAGIIDVSEKISFEEEAKKGEYISGRIVDVTNDKKEVVRSAVPIKTRLGKVKAIMYGTMDVTRFEARYATQAKNMDAYLSIIEGKSGQFIFDTKNEDAGNVTSLASISYKDGYDYEKFANDLTEGNAGYTSFVGRNLDEYLYIRYDTLNIGDWRILLAQPETVVYAGTKSTVRFLISTSSLILLIMIIYMLLIIWQIRKMLRMNSFAADIRKSLLEISQFSESLDDALMLLTRFAQARSAFISDSKNHVRHYVVPDKSNESLNENEMEYFNNKLLSYTAKNRRIRNVPVYLSQIDCNKNLRAEMGGFYDFMLSYKIKSIKYAVVVNSNNSVYVIGVVNPKNKDASQLLNKIAVCFSMAVYNNEHLENTERLALTDSLTGIANRMAYKHYIKTSQNDNRILGCIYVDVNELHFYNNKYGHVAGDTMLVFIVTSLKKHFEGENIYRMGGDEFLIICKGISEQEINERLAQAITEIEEMKYHIAVGVKCEEKWDDVENVVNEAERIMYENKARYYQDKELGRVENISPRDTVAFKTGVKELDACLSIMSLRYFGVYSVSFDKDKCVRILAPSYFRDLSDENNLYSTSLKRYIYEFAKPEYHRTLLSFIDYEALKKSLMNGAIPSCTYERIDGEKVLLKVYPVENQDEGLNSIWVFERIDN